MLSRKKRRGIIEKRRRDRINTSLSELRRLVPTAYEKQGSAKLEKAEILQMTVDHLKMLHSKGFDALAYDPSKFAMDYHNIGFRECSAEVARYLVSVEGLHLDDPLRRRLISHLECFAAQREFAATKQSSASAPAWYSPASNSIPPTSSANLNPSQNYQSGGSPLSPITGGNSHNQHHNHHNHHHHSILPPPVVIPPPLAAPPNLPIGCLHHNSSLNSSSGSSSSLNSSIPSGSATHSSSSLNSSFESNVGSCQSTSTSSSTSGQLSTSIPSSSTMTPLTTVSSSITTHQDGYQHDYNPSHHHHLQQQQQQQHLPPSMELSAYHHHHNNHHHHHLGGMHAQHSMHQQQQNLHHAYGQVGNDPSGVSSQMKPYRPWGTELAY